LYSSILYTPADQSTFTNMLSNPKPNTDPIPPPLPHQSLTLPQRPNPSLSVASSRPTSSRPDRPLHPVWFVHKVISLQKLLCLDALNSANQSEHIWNKLKTLVRVPDHLISSHQLTVANYTIHSDELIQHCLVYHQYAIVSSPTTYATNVAKDPKECGVSRCFMYNRATDQTNANVFLPSFDALSCYYMMQDILLKVRTDRFRRPPTILVPPIRDEPVYRLDPQDYDVKLGSFPVANLVSPPPRADYKFRRPATVAPSSQTVPDPDSAPGTSSPPTYKKFPRIT
jgi:hypothetical protein